MAARPETAYIYVMGTLDGPSKIGHSLNPTRRLKDIQRLNPRREVFITGTWPVGVSIALGVERYIQFKLRDRHIRSEWFDAPREEIVAMIKQALDRTDEFDRWAAIPPLDPPGLPVKNGEHIRTSFPKGTRGRIAAVLETDGNQAQFIRSAIEKELKRRERRS